MKNWILTLLIAVSAPAIGYYSWTQSGDVGDVIAIVASLLFAAYLLFTNSNSES